MTEGRYALGALTAFAVWVFGVLPFLYQAPMPQEYQAHQTETSAQYADRSNEGAGATQSGSNQSFAKPNTSADPKSEPEKDGSEFWSAKLTDWLLALFTLALVVFTALLYKATAGMWNATKGLRDFAEEQSRDMKASIAVAQRASEASERSADLAEKALHTTERAFVYLHEIKIDYITEDSVEFRGYVVAVVLTPFWANSGTTPTKRGLCHTSWGQFVQGTGPETIRFDNRQDPNVLVGRSPIFVAPKANYRGVPVRITRQQLLSPNTRFAWGWIDYDDIFGVRHRTEFCVEIIPAAGPIGMTDWIRLRAYRLHNGSDDECYRQPSPFVVEP